MPAFAGGWALFVTEAMALALLPALFLLALLLRALQAPAWRETFLSAVSKIAPRAGSLLRGAFGAGGVKEAAVTLTQPQPQRRRRDSDDSGGGGDGAEQQQHDHHHRHRDQRAKKKQTKKKEWYVTRADLDYFEDVVRPVEARLLAGEPLGSDWSLVMAMSNDAPGKPQYAYRSYMRALPNGTSEYL
jgi:hypothetical protein